jgi:hypothetical protein
VIRLYLCPYCEQDSGGNHAYSCPNHPRHLKAQTDARGWICPVCGQVNAPWVESCPGPLGLGHYEFVIRGEEVGK